MLIFDRFYFMISTIITDVYNSIYSMGKRRIPQQPEEHIQVHSQIP